MANPNHIKLLHKGKEVWNNWRMQNWNSRPDLSKSHLGDINLSGYLLHDADFSRVELEGADLSAAHFERADFRMANLTSANLERSDLSSAQCTSILLKNANLTRANLERAKLHGANLEGAILHQAKLVHTDLTASRMFNADITEAWLDDTVFGDTTLSGVHGLDSCIHAGPSTIDMRSLRTSWPLPLSFLRGCGLDDTFIDYLPGLIGEAIQFYSCFISYSSSDENFVKRLYADLQDNGVRCWFAPEDIKAGKKLGSLPVRCC